MKNKISKIISNNRIDTSQTVFNLRSSAKFKIKSSVKTSLETLLNEIKNREVAILSEAKLNQNIIKTVLSELAIQLKCMLELKYVKLKNTKKALTESKNELKKQQNGLTKVNISNSKNKNRIYSNYITELTLLKNMNFTTEYYIKYIDNLTSKITFELDYLRVSPEWAYKAEKEIYCFKEKYFQVVNNLLKKQIEKVKNKYKLIELEKQSRNEEIERVSKNLALLKNDISPKHNEYKDENKEIKEDKSKESTQSLSGNKIDNRSNNDSKMKEEENSDIAEYASNIIIVDFTDDEMHDFTFDNKMKMKKKVRNYKSLRNPKIKYSFKFHRNFSLHSDKDIIDNNNNNLNNSGDDKNNSDDIINLMNNHQPKLLSNMSLSKLKM
jgi:hypothetical protein